MYYSCSVRDVCKTQGPDEKQKVSHLFLWQWIVLIKLIFVRTPTSFGCRYYPALKTLEQLEHTYLPRIKRCPVINFNANINSQLRIRKTFSYFVVQFVKVRSCPARCFRYSDKNQSIITFWLHLTTMFLQNLFQWTSINHKYIVVWLTDLDLQRLCKTVFLFYGSTSKKHQWLIWG